MNTKEAIQSLENIKHGSERRGWDFEGSFLSLAITALKEKEEREKGCEYCAEESKKLIESAWGDLKAWIFKDNLYNTYEHRDTYSSTGTKINFCPMCGKKLKEGKE